MEIKPGDTLEIWVQDLEGRGRVAIRQVMELSRDLPVVFEDEVSRVLSLSDIISVNGVRVEVPDSAGYLPDLCKIFGWDTGTRVQVMDQIELLYGIAQEVRGLLYVLYPRAVPETWQTPFVGILRLAEMVRKAFRTREQRNEGSV